jgi:molybdopterin/thiamine biosynthesis adenylyltransferase
VFNFQTVGNRNCWKMAQFEGVLAADLQTRIQESRLLMVGAGGIGCELLKNIVLTGRRDLY